MKIIKVTNKTIKKYYNDPTGNLYYCLPDEDEFQLVMDFYLEDCKIGLTNGISFIFISGKPLSLEESKE